MNPQDLTIKELKELIKDPNTSSTDLHQIYWAFKDWTIFADIAENPNVSSTTLQLIAEDEDCWVRASVADSPNCPQHILSRLAKDMGYTVRSRVFRNPNTKEEDLLMIKAIRWMQNR